MGALVYARSSSEQQSEHSIDDQLRIYRTPAKRESSAVTEVYAGGWSKLREWLVPDTASPTLARR